MPKMTWTVTADAGATSFTSRVLSLNITGGREQYLDTYSGGQCVFTINNNDNIAYTIQYGKKIEVKGAYSTGFFNCYFWVQKITYNDYPGNTGLSTATITCADWISRAGRINATNLVISQDLTGQQLESFEYPGILPSDMEVSTSGSQSTASGITYTGTVNNYLNLLVTTERGYCSLILGAINFVGRAYVSNRPPIATKIGRTTSSTRIAYQQFERIANGFEFINTATVSPNGLASQTSTNSTSVSTYGPAFYSSSTVDYTTTQASGNADWIVNNFGDPTAERFFCSFTDLAQNGTALTSWLNECFQNTNSTVNLEYRPPGYVSDLSENVVMEGYTINVTPEQTTFDLSFSPLRYYQFFTLNSTTLGILDTSRLGW
ncbi:hypothetical protein UFOVP800_11 [uncultured Caudovirales phage]|uniref:Uncharacterized protein n=1 Tax=uncultured Caudovirales phage TaxID=2100421 RepID=A0A6J5NW48_9CAUD|nr:hypothetical protein UFOVP800_11 [uncultured Caudovirales phage]